SGVDSDTNWVLSRQFHALLLGEGWRAVKRTNKTFPGELESHAETSITDDVVADLPAAPAGGALCQVDPLGAVLSRPAALTGLSRRRQIEQSGIFPQPADHHRACGDRPLQKR